MSTENINSEVISEETESKEVVSSNPMDYKAVIDMLNEMDEQYKMLKNISVQSIHTAYDLKPEILTDIIPITKEDIDLMSEEEMISFIKAHKYNPDIENTVAPREIMHSVKDTSMNVLTAKIETDNIHENSKEVLNEYFEYATSKKAVENRLKRVETLKAAVENETDPLKKKIMTRQLNTIESANTLSFLFKRFENIGKKEVDSIKKAFFDDKLGHTIIERYRYKIIKFGFDAKLHTYFLNLEENFLGEEYYCFNNLFLFIFMRMVVHMSPYEKSDKLYVQSLISSMSNLVYHRFDSYINEEGFINIIKRVISYFEDYREYFTENNTTSPIHPKRIEADKVYDAKRREALITKMDELKITGYDVNASCDDLQKYLNDSLDNMIKAQIPPKPEEETEENKEENNEENESDIEVETFSEVSTDETDATE